MKLQLLPPGRASDGDGCLCVLCACMSVCLHVFIGRHCMHTLVKSVLISACHIRCS